jgi:hypothetical protein
MPVPDKAIYSGKRVRHKQYDEEGTIVSFGTTVKIELDSGRELEIMKIILWEVFEPLEDE